MVYPHACGERIIWWLGIIQLRGLSPRLWGTVRLLRICKIYLRFIPTPVGNGQPVASIISSSSVYPHACGERQNIINRHRYFIGLSPRLWGTVQSQQYTAWLSRFIPTPVGNGFYALQELVGRSVYPHACGERYEPDQNS